MNVNAALVFTLHIVARKMWADQHRDVHPRKDCSLIPLACSDGSLPERVKSSLLCHFMFLPRTPSCLGQRRESGLGRPNTSPSVQISESELFVIPTHRSCCNAHDDGFPFGQSVLANGIKLYEYGHVAEYLRRYTHVLWSVGHVS